VRNGVPLNSRSVPSTIDRCGNPKRVHMADSPQFSVVVPLYNKRPYIRRAVDSVLGQTFEDFEMIVVDDGSTDGSADALQDFADGRMRIIRQANAGVGAARNRGMAEAAGCWIAFLDADDAWLPDHLDELAELAGEFPEAGLLSTTCVEAVGAQLPVVPKPDGGAARREIDYFFEASRRIGVINSTSAAVRRAIVQELGGFLDKRAGEDLEYWARWALCAPVFKSDKVTCVYFRDTGGVMASLALQKHSGQRRIRHLHEVSPSIAMLCERAEQSPELWNNPSIRAYVNSRLSNGIKGAIYRGDSEAARDIAAMMISPWTVRASLFRAVLWLHPQLLRGVSAAYRRFKGL